MREDDSARGTPSQEAAGDDAGAKDPKRGDPNASDGRGSEGIELPGGGVLEQDIQEELPYEVSFDDLVRPFLVMGLTGVGVLPHPESGKSEFDLRTARHAIDVLEILQARTEGRRDEKESALLERALFELKMHFVEARRDERRG